MSTVSLQEKRVDPFLQTTADFLQFEDSFWSRARNH